MDELNEVILSEVMNVKVEHLGLEIHSSIHSPVFFLFETAYSTIAVAQSLLFEYHQA